MEMKLQVTAALASLIIATNIAAQNNETMDNVLNERQQHLAAISCLEAKGDITNLSSAIDDALDDEVSVEEIKEALSQLYAYTGFPRSLNGLGALQNVVNERRAAGKTTVQGNDAAPVGDDYDPLAQGTEVQTRLSGGPFNYDFCPATDYYLKAHLFGDIFSRNNLTFADRELVTVSALSGLEGVEPQRKSHAAGSLRMGLTEAELRSIPAVLAERVGDKEAYRLRKTIAEVFGEEFDELPPMQFGRGAFNSAYAQYFIGNSYLDVKSKADDPLHISNVTFEPGCRNNWHIHHAVTGGGQVLICIEGEGWYQEWGKQPQRLHPGDIVEIPAGVKHWHGATVDSWFSHLAFEIPGTETSNEWLEPVDDEHYLMLESE